MTTTSTTSTPASAPASITNLAAFKAYDVRGRIPDELNETLAARIARAYTKLFQPKSVVIGRDMRLSSPSIAKALGDAFLEVGVDVVDIGLCGTEMVYFATFFLEALGVDGGLMVTASHNPADYNGIKMVGKGATPISGDTGLKAMALMCHDDQAFDVEKEVLQTAHGKRGTYQERNVLDDYVSHLLTYVDISQLTPLTVVANPGNGCAGIVLDAIRKRLPFHWYIVNGTPDGTFPNGVPNPLLPENRDDTADHVISQRADIGIAWDGDFDRCFFFDEQGAFIEGYYMVGLFAEELLQQDKGAAIIHDPRLVWNTVEMVEASGGRAVQSKAGHAFIKEVMRRENAIYGGEMSAHHYFRRFAFCDSGMIPWLLLLQTMARTQKPLSTLVAERIQKYPASGEINLHIDDSKKALDKVRATYASNADFIDETDGLSCFFKDWRFNVRRSNTEPVVRVNVESRGDVALMQKKTDEILALLQS